MILNRNYVLNGQTLFAGERISADVSAVLWTAKEQKPMTWLSEHQTNLRIEKEVRQEHILSQHRQSLG